MSQEELREYYKLVVRGGDSARAVQAIRRKAGVISETPTALQNWVSENSERIAGWKQRPYWMQDNAKLFP